VAVVAVVIGIFFVVGLFVGAVVVIALPALRQRSFRRARQRRRADGPVESSSHRVNPGAARWEDAAADDRPRWPGDADGPYPGRQA